MKKLFIVIIAISLFSACSSKKETQTNVLSTEQKSAEEIQKEEDSKFYTEALANTNPEICKNIKNAEISENCFAAVITKNAVEKGNAEICKGIENIEKQKICEDKVTFEKETNP